MNVLAVIQTWNPDDPVRGFTVDWMRALAERVGELVVLTLEDRSASRPTTDDGRPTTDDRRPTTRGAGARAEPTIHSLGKETTRRPFRRVRYLARWNRMLPRLLDDHRIDVIFTHMAPIYSVLAAPYARRRGIPIVTWFAHRVVTPKIRLAHRLSSRVATIDEASYPLGGRRVRYLGHGIDVDRFAPADGRIADRRSPVSADSGQATLPGSVSPSAATPGSDPVTSAGGSPAAGTPLVLSVGRLSPVKGQLVLLEAVRRLLDEGVELRCELVGGAPERDAAYADRVRRRIEELGLEEEVSMPGALPPAALPEHYRAAAAHVSCAPRDNALDKVVLEAAACGTPSLTSAETAADTLGPLADHLLFAAADAGELAAKLRAVLEMDPAARQEMARPLRQRVVERHSLDHLADGLVEVFEEAIRGGGRQGSSASASSSASATTTRNA